MLRNANIPETAISRRLTAAYTYWSGRRPAKIYHWCSLQRLTAGAAKAMVRWALIQSCSW